MKTSKIHRLAARVDAVLHEFKEIPLREESDYPGEISGWGAPTLYVGRRKDDAVFNLPKAGQAVVNYRVRNKSVAYQDDGTERYSTDIAVDSIEPVKLEAILEKYEFSGRARDGGGRFAPGMAVTPEDMADAYGEKKKKKQAVAAGIGGAGLATAAVMGRNNPALAGAMGRMARRVV